MDSYTGKSSVQWGNPDWGKPGHNVHESSTGSWLESDRKGTN